MCTLLVVQQVDRLKNMIHNKFRKDRIMKRRNVLTNAGGGGPLLTGTSAQSVTEMSSRNKFGMTKNAAFTMAEILLSLTIIGVVAAITLPSLTGNINERTWNTQRKALYARFSQAIALMPSLNGYGTLTEDESGSITEDNAAETFVTAGLSKVLKINNICDSEHLSDCGIPSKVILGNGSIAFTEFPKTLFSYNSRFNISYYSTPDTKVAAFETVNGESIAVFYNPRCTALPYQVSSIFLNTFQQMCANFVYDLNGSKGPNTVGKDIGFITALYPTDPVVVAPVYISKSVGAWGNYYEKLSSLCKQVDPDSRVPNIEELKSLVYNNPLVRFGEGSNWIWSSTRIDENYVYTMGLDGNIILTNNGNRGDLRCVKR